MAGNIGPSLPPAFAARLRKQREEEEKDEQQPSVQDDQDDDLYGPALPPGFKKSSSPPAVGPSLPPALQSSLRYEYDDSDEEEIIGPLPPSSSDMAYNSSKHHLIADIEKRAKKMKEKLDDAKKPKKLEREEWMLELPSAAQDLGLGPRTFRKKAKNLGDRSVWTDTPHDKERKRKQQPKGEDPDVKRFRERDMEIEEKMSQVKSSSTSESLLDLHMKDRKKKIKAEEEKHLDADGKPERRPFDRDLDLQVNRFDNAAKMRMIKQSQQLSSRFQHAEQSSKYI